VAVLRYHQTGCELDCGALAAGDDVAVRHNLVSIQKPTGAKGVFESEWCNRPTSLLVTSRTLTVPNAGTMTRSMVLSSNSCELGFFFTRAYSLSRLLTKLFQGVRLGDRRPLTTRVSYRRVDVSGVETMRFSTLSATC
jgi:hypothetical protein